MSHRPAFRDENNTFWSIDFDGNFHLDGELVQPTAVPNWVKEAMDFHVRYGVELSCIHCQKAAEVVDGLINFFGDPRTPEQRGRDDDAADYAATIEGVRP